MTTDQRLDAIARAALYADRALRDGDQNGAIEGAQTALWFATNGEQGIDWDIVK